MYRTSGGQWSHDLLHIVNYRHRYNCQQGIRENMTALGYIHAD